MMDQVHEVRKGQQELRRGEGITWRIDVSGWGTPTAGGDIEIIRMVDNEDVTTAFTNDPTSTPSGDSIVIPEIVVPADAVLGIYRLTFPFKAEGFNPGRPFVEFLVKD